jgi:hypothetical protein
MPCPSHLPWLDLPNSTSWSVPVMKRLQFLQTPATSSLLDPNILLSILFSNTLNLCSSRSVRQNHTLFNWRGDFYWCIEYIITLTVLRVGQFLRFHFQTLSFYQQLLMSWANLKNYGSKMRRKGQHHVVYYNYL